MGLFKKKSDPITERARALNAEIAALESKIKNLDSQLQQNRDPKPGGLRSTALPDGRTIVRPQEPQNAAQLPAHAEPIFEEVDQKRLDAGEASTPEHFNELGVRKYDLPATLRRLRNHFTGPSTSNPKLVKYIAAGGIQGLRPLRYEKRVARNRFISLVVVILIILLGAVLASLPR